MQPGGTPRRTQRGSEASWALPCGVSTQRTLGGQGACGQSSSPQAGYSGHAAAQEPPGVPAARPEAAQGSGSAHPSR